MGGGRWHNDGHFVARRAAKELADLLIDVSGEAFYELGEIRPRMGDHPAADAMFAEAHGGAGTRSPASRRSTVPSCCPRWWRSPSPAEG